MKAKILIAEDDANIRLGLIATLESEGYSVTAASDGAQALKLFPQEKFELVLLDVMMPKASGYDVCRELRAKGAGVPVLFLTAKGEEIDKVCKWAGAIAEQIGLAMQLPGSLLN